MGRVRSRRSVVGIFIFVSLLFAQVMQAGADPVPCSRYTSATTAPSPYGLAWNWLSSEEELLLSAMCEGTATTVSIGKTNTNLPANNQGLIFSWGKAYAYDGSSWNVDKPIPLTCNGTKVEVADVTPADTLPDYWCNGTLTGTLPSNASFFAAYTCGFNGTTWQCGCTDVDCTQSFWQLQGVNRHVKIIYLGIYGASPPFQAPDWVDPRDHYLVFPINDSIIDTIAFNDSILSAVGLKIASAFPTSITLVIGFDNITPIGKSDIISDLIQRLYYKGDKVYLAGHSFGGSIVQEVAKKLKRIDIPVQMTAQIDSIGFDALISNNVIRAFNFYYPKDFACPLVGEKNIHSEDPEITIVSNQEISDPIGPDSGFCAAHKNMDNDPRVWPPIVDYIFQSVEGH